MIRYLPKLYRPISKFEFLELSNVSIEDTDEEIEDDLDFSMF